MHLLHGYGPKLWSASLPPIGEADFAWRQARSCSAANVSKLRLDIFEGMVKNRNIELLLRSWIAAHAGS